SSRSPLPAHRKSCSFHTGSSLWCQTCHNAECQLEASDRYECGRCRGYSWRVTRKLFLLQLLGRDRLLGGGGCNPLDSPSRVNEELPVFLHHPDFKAVVLTCFPHR